MNSYLTEDFLACFRQLPQNVKEKARKNYRLWKQNRNHPSLRFKRVHPNEPIYSVRVGIGWRAMGLWEDNDIYWFWIGSHAEYDKLLNQLQDPIQPLQITTGSAVLDALGIAVDFDLDMFQPNSAVLVSPIGSGSKATRSRQLNLVDQTKRQ